jgi:hypothetical protein
VSGRAVKEAGIPKDACFDANGGTAAADAIGYFLGPRLLIILGLDTIVMSLPLCFR